MMEEGWGVEIIHWYLREKVPICMAAYMLNSSKSSIKKNHSCNVFQNDKCKMIFMSLFMAFTFLQFVTSKYGMTFFLPQKRFSTHISWTIKRVNQVRMNTDKKWPQDEEATMNKKMEITHWCMGRKMPTCMVGLLVLFIWEEITHIHSRLKQRLTEVTHTCCHWKEMGNTSVETTKPHHIAPPKWWRPHPAVGPPSWGWRESKLRRYRRSWAESTWHWWMSSPWQHRVYKGEPIEGVPAGTLHCWPGWD